MMVHFSVNHLSRKQFYGDPHSPRECGLETALEPPCTHSCSKAKADNEWPVGSALSPV